MRKPWLMKMKRLFAVLLVIAAVFGLISCSAGASQHEPVPADYREQYALYPDEAILEGENGKYLDGIHLSESSGEDSRAKDSEEVGSVENAFILTADEAVSTFSADVDTASYTMMRKVLTQGRELSYYQAAIRIEELINYFDYDYEKPTGNDLFGVKAQISDCPWNPEAKLLVLGLAAKEAVQNTAGNNLVFLIDVSGSMKADDKLPLLQKSFSYLVSNLTKKDCVSIVTYSGKESVVLKACAGNERQKIMDAVNGLVAKGTTNGESGLEKAYEIAESCFIEGGNNRIIMASDGDLNVGISNPEELKAFVEEKRDKGVYLSVLGFGDGNYRDGNMEALADNGNGVYYYIDSEREAERIFCDKLTATLYTVANDVKLQLTFNPAVVYEYRLVGYENRLLSKEDFTDDTKDAGELGAGHTVTVCYELKLAEDKGDADWAQLACRWKNVGETQSSLQEVSIGASAYTETPDNDFRFVTAVAEFGLLLKGSKYVSANVQIGDVQKILSNVVTSDEYKKEFMEIVKNYVK